MQTNLDPYLERIYLAWSKVSRKIKSEVMHQKDLGLTGPQFHMLTRIHKLQCCKATHLAELLEVKPSAITVMIDRLVNNGYVARRHDEQDRRVVLVTITPLGDEVLMQAKKRSRDVVKSYFSYLEASEIEALTEIIEKLSKIDTKEDVVDETSI